MPTLYVFAVMQLTRFRPVRGVLRTASTDSIVLRPEGEASASPQEVPLGYTMCGAFAALIE